MFDRGELVDQLVGDPELLAEVIGDFLEDCPRRLTAIRSAINRQDPEHVRATALALKASAATVGATAVFEAAQTIERLCAEGRLEPLEAAWRRLSTEATLVLEALRLSSHPQPRGVT